MSKKVFIILMMVFLFGPVNLHAQDEFAEAVKYINDPNYLTSVVEFMQSVIDGSIAVQDGQLNEAYFWLAEAYYKGKLTGSQVANGVDFYVSGRSSIYQMFDESKNRFANNSKFYGASLEKMAWCLYRQAELEDIPGNLTYLENIIELMNNHSNILEKLAPEVKDRLKVINADTRLRIMAISKFHNTDVVSPDDTDGIINMFPDGNVMDKEIFKAYLNLEKGKLLAVIRNFEGARSAFGAVSGTVDELLSSHTNSLSEFEKGHLENYRVIAKLYLFSMSNAEMDVGSLTTLTGEIPNIRDDNVTMRKLEGYNFFMLFDRNTLLQSQVRPEQVKSELYDVDLDDSKNRVESNYWKGWSEFLKSYRPEEEKFKGEDEFRAFLTGIELPRNNRNTVIKSRRDFIALDGCYRLAEIYFKNNDLDNAKRYYSRINNIESVYKEEITKNLLICELSDISTGNRDVLLPKFLYEVKYNDDLTYENKIETVLDLAKRLILKGIGTRNRSAGKRYLEISDFILASLYPGFDHDLYRVHTRTDPPSGNYPVILTVKPVQRLSVTLNLLKVRNMVELTSYQSLEDTESTLVDAARYLRKVSSSQFGPELEDELEYIEAIIDYAVAKNKPEVRPGRYEIALEKFANLLKKDSYVNVRSLLNIGLTLNSLGEQDDAYKCYKHLLEIIPDRSEYVYRMASEKLGIRDVTVQDKIEYSKEDGKIDIGINLVKKYTPPPDGAITYEGIIEERYDFSDIRTEYLEIWRKYSMPHITIHPSIHKTVGYNEYLFPVFTVN